MRDWLPCVYGVSCVLREYVACPYPRPIYSISLLYSTKIASEAHGDWVSCSIEMQLINRQNLLRSDVPPFFLLF